MQTIRDRRLFIEMLPDFVDYVFLNTVCPKELLESTKNQASFTALLQNNKGVFK